VAPSSVAATPQNPGRNSLASVSCVGRIDWARHMASERLTHGYGGRHYDSEAIRSLSDRDFRIDLFRGLSLWWIFLDHIPESYLNHFTPKNFGFSGARRARADQATKPLPFPGSTVDIARRTWKISRFC